MKRKREPLVDKEKVLKKCPEVKVVEPRARIWSDRVVSSFSELKKPAYLSEFEVHADLYSKLKEEGFDVRGSVSHSSEGQYVVFDLVVYHGDRALAVIEVKRSNKSWNFLQEHIYRLASNNLPLLLYNERSEYGTLCDNLKAMMDDEYIYLEVDGNYVLNALALFERAA